MGVPRHAPRGINPETNRSAELSARVAEGPVRLPGFLKPHSPVGLVAVSAQKLAGLGESIVEVPTAKSRTNEANAGAGAYRHARSSEGGALQVPVSEWCSFR